MDAIISQVLALHLTRHGADRLKELVAASPVARLMGLESSLTEFEAKAASLGPEILLVEYAPDHPGLDDLLERVRRLVPRGAVVAWSTNRDPEVILQAIRAGAREYLAEPLAGGAFNEAVLRLRRQAATATKPAGRLMAVIGAKGGVGSSHLALNLAFSLSREQGQRVALVDFDRSGGDLAFMLDLEPKRDLSDVVRNFDHLDAVLMDNLLLEAGPNLKLLAAPADQVLAEEVQPAHLARALEYLSDSYNLVIMDTSSRLDEISLLSLDKAEIILLVLEPAVVCLKSARRLLDLSQRLGYGTHKIAVVVNRYDAKGAIGPKEVVKVLGRKVLAWLPNDSAAVMAAGNAGRPVLAEDEKSRWSRAVSDLARRLYLGLNLPGGQSAAGDKPPFLRRLLGGQAKAAEGGRS